MMTRVCWRLVDILSRMLDADERQTVLGDLAESGQDGSRVVSGNSICMDLQGMPSGRALLAIR
jgi:hypothetical protein